MGDMSDYFDGLKAHKNALKALYGIQCPMCLRLRPKACPTILLPAQRCFDGFKDVRPPLTAAQHSNALVDFQNIHASVKK